MTHKKLNNYLPGSVYTCTVCARGLMQHGAVQCGAVKRVLQHESTRFETGRVCPTAVGWVKEWGRQGQWASEVSGSVRSVGR